MRIIYILLVVLREGNRKSPRTAAHICKSISEIQKIKGVAEKFPN